MYDLGGTFSSPTFEWSLIWFGCSVYRIWFVYRSCGSLAFWVIIEIFEIWKQDLWLVWTMRRKIWNGDEMVRKIKNIMMGWWFGCSICDVIGLVIKLHFIKKFDKKCGSTNDGQLHFDLNLVSVLSHTSWRVKNWKIKI